jgi:hypothetical protein
VGNGIRGRDAEKRNVQLSIVAGKKNEKDDLLKSS